MRHWIFFAGVLLLILPAQAWAHGGEHAAPATQIQKPAPLPDRDMDHSLSGGMSAPAADNDFYGVGSSEPLEGEVPLDLDSVDMEDHAGHNMMNMPEVEIAKHQWNSTSQKGYGLAVGITLISGLGFLFLSLKRPLE